MFVMFLGVPAKDAYVIVYCNNSGEAIGADLCGFGICLWAFSGQMAYEGRYSIPCGY